MNVFGIFLQLGAVFLGAFLAFWLENCRERKNLRGWANRYLKLDREDIDLEATRQFVDKLEEVVEGYDACISGERATYVSWQPLMSLFINLSRDYSVILDSKAALTLPAEVATKLHIVSRHLRADKELASVCSAAHQQYAIPIFFSKEHELSLTEIQSLRYIRQLFVHRVASMKKVLALGRELLELLDKHHLGR